MTLTGSTFFFPWEIRLMEFLQAHIGGAGVSLVSSFSIFGEELFLILFLGFIYWGLDKRLGEYIGLNMLAASVWNPMAKNVVLRRRPYFDSETIRILRVVEPSADIYDISAQGYSFPSGHSTCAAALFASLAARGRKRLFLAAAVLLPLLVGFSRVFVGAHYPTDVVAGWLFGLAAVWLVPLLERKCPNRAVFTGVILLTALPGVFFCKSTDYYTCLGLLLGFLAGTSVERRCVRFENTRNLLRCVLRVAGGMAVFFVLNTLLKLPFPKEFLDGGSRAALLVRCARYALVSFADFALYPLVFRYAARIGVKQPAAA